MALASMVFVVPPASREGSSSWSVPVFIAMVLYATVLYLMLPRAERRIAFSGEQKIEL